MENPAVINTEIISDQPGKVILPGETAVYDLIKRVLPEHYQLFEVNLNESSGEYFKISSSKGRIVLEGSTPVSVASALNWYLKYYQNSHTSWSGNQVKFKETLSDNIQVTVNSQFSLRYYLNYCTYSYSMPWWTWERWEKEIDFMAMNGINITLALAGQEAVWQEFLLKLGCTKKEIFEFLPGPAYLAWGWLNNLDGWGGPTTQNWIDDQKELQFKILERLRSLKILPVLQAFVGRVPKALTKIFPDAKIIKLPGWYGFEGVHFLDPSDPLFNKLNNAFLDTQKNLYGNDHYFAGDVFHEIDSSDKSHEHMGGIYKGIQENLLSFDNEAKWLLQSWTIREDGLSSLKNEHTVILDMFCESESKWDKTENFHGHQWIWSIINNFGGRTGLGGPVRKIVTGLKKAKEGTAKNKLCGIGIAPEGIENNPAVYEMLLELNWREDIINIEEWMVSFAGRRYGYNSENINKAWKLLLKTVYSGPEKYAPVETVICAAPSLNIKSAGSNGFIEGYYNNSELKEAAELLLKEKNKLTLSETFRHDVVDIVRQVGTNIANVLYSHMVRSYNEKDIEGFRLYSDTFIDLCYDLDEMLSGSSYFSLGSWLESAKNKAKDKNDMVLLEWNARRQITLWSSPEITEFHDYANKQWGGLIKDYYIPRWKEFITACVNAMTQNSQINEDNLKEKYYSLAVEWSEKKDVYNITNGKDSIELAERFLKKYKRFAER